MSVSFPLSFSPIYREVILFFHVPSMRVCPPPPCDARVLFSHSSSFAFT